MSETETKGLVLVTGGSGFVGSHLIIKLLQAGYLVRTTVRSPNRVGTVRNLLKAGGATEDQVDSVQFTTADLAKDDGWADAVKGCVYVHHVASPFPLEQPKNEDDVIIPARDGTLRVLRAAKAAETVKRIIMTSSFVAIAYGHPDRGTQPFTEKDWSVTVNPARKITPYVKSKTIAEQAAWDFMAKEGGKDGMELSVVNPGAIFGPILAKDSSASVELVSRLMSGSIPALPKIGFGAVDVRDVADLHLRCMLDPKAAGERFVALAKDGNVTPRKVALMLKERMGPKASKVTTREAPNLLIKLASLVDRSAASVVAELGVTRIATNEKAISVLGWQPRSAEDSVVATAESLEKFL